MGGAAVSAIGWPERLLAALGLPTTEANIVFIRKWEQAEGSKARHNPLATTQKAPGATDFNSVGVKNYNTEQTGLIATVQTLKNGRYDAVLDALRKSDPVAAANAVVASPWGTGKQLVTLVDPANGTAEPQGVTGGIATGVVNEAKSVGDLIGVLTNQGTWLRVVQVAAGVGAVGLGLLLLNKNTVTKAVSAVGGAVPGAVAGKAVGAGAGVARAAAAAV